METFYILSDPMLTIRYIRVVSVDDEGQIQKPKFGNKHTKIKIWNDHWEPVFSSNVHFSIQIWGSIYWKECNGSVEENREIGFSTLTVTFPIP